MAVDGVKVSIRFLVCCQHFHSELVVELDSPAHVGCQHNLDDEMATVPIIINMQPTEWIVHAHCVHNLQARCNVVAFQQTLARVSQCKGTARVLKQNA